MLLDLTVTKQQQTFKCYTYLTYNCVCVCVHASVCVCMCARVYVHAYVYLRTRTLITRRPAKLVNILEVLVSFQPSPENTEKNSSLHMS